MHRDLKPANILVRAGGDGNLEYKITDFGLGAVATRQSIQMSQCGSRGQVALHSVLGAFTPLYAPPQQTLGGQPDPRDDVYALGVIWYQLLTGDLSRGCPTGARWQDRLKNQGMPTQQIDLLSACIEEDPQDRISHAGILSEELTEALNQQNKKGHSQESGIQDLTQDYAAQLRESAEAWAFAGKYHGNPSFHELLAFINGLADQGMVGGSRLTRAQAEVILCEVCAQWQAAGKNERKQEERAKAEKSKKEDKSGFSK